MKHREFATCHGYDGFTLVVRDYIRWRWHAGNLAETLLHATGLCCGVRLGRIPGTDYVGFKLLNAAGALQHRNSTQLEQVRLTTNQAVTINPRWAADIGDLITVDGEDEDGDIYQDAALVAVKCRDCGDMIDAAGRWHNKVIEEHTCAA